MNTPKFWTIYNYQNEIFSMVVNNASSNTEVSELQLSNILTKNIILAGSSDIRLYKYTPDGAFHNQKIGFVDDFDSYLLECSSQSSSLNSSCVLNYYYLCANNAKGIFFNPASTFYNRCNNPNLATYYNRANPVKELDCIYENGLVSSSIFIKDLNLWKYEYIDYRLCYQEDISNNINSILNFNKFNESEISNISSARAVGSYKLIHSFLKNSDYNRKNLIKKSEFLLKNYGYISNGTVVDYSTSPVGSKILEGANGRNLHLQYFNKINFYTDSELANFSSSFSSRPSYLKNIDTKYSTIYNEKALTSDPIKLPPAKFDSRGFPIKRYVRVTKLSNETRSTLIKKDISLNKVTEVIPTNFSYPFSALVATKIDSRSMSSLPVRTFDCKLKKVLVPSNYYPLDNVGRDVRYSLSRGSTIIYRGSWDGTFKLAWTDNPAWILMDLLINKRYGLGNYIESSQIDIWELYQISKWCDACDENGIFWGVPDSYSGYEPRHTFNALIIDKFNVYDLLNNIMSIFKGSVYYSNSMISFDDDRIKDIAGTIASTDVRDGTFNFGNFKKDEEFTAIEVSYLDRRDSYKPKIEYVEDAEAIRKRGILKKQVSPIGITSRGQAIRYARHILFQTAKEGGNISFSIDSKILIYNLGDLIKIDPSAEERKQFGRILDIDTVVFPPKKPQVRLFVDACIDSRFFDTSKIDILTRKQVTKENETYFDTVKCTYFINSHQVLQDAVSTCGTYVILHNSGIVCTQTLFSNNDLYHNECSFQTVEKNINASEFNETSAYSLRIKEKKDKIYKIASITENSSSEFTIFATEFCSTKFDLIEGDVPKDIDTNNYFYTANQDSSIISRPPSVFFSKIEKINISGYVGVKVSWMANPNVNGYNLYMVRPDSQRQILTRAITSTTDIYAGNILISQYDPSKKEYYYIFLENANQIGTFKFAIETFVVFGLNSEKRTSQITNKTINL